MFIRLVALLLLLQIFSSCQNQKNKVQLREGESLTSLVNGIQSCFSDYEIPFHTTVDDETLQELFYIDPEDVEAVSYTHLMILKLSRGANDCLLPCPAEKMIMGYSVILCILSQWRDVRPWKVLFWKNIINIFPSRKYIPKTQKKVTGKT